MLPTFLLIVLFHSFAHSQESKLYQIDSVQLSRANQNYVYARSCKEIKDTLFIALDTALSIIGSQKLQIAAKDSLIANKDEKYKLCEESELGFKKQAKKEKTLKKINGFLLYTTTATSIILATLYMLK